jgi:hypothetical protein
VELFGMEVGDRIRITQLTKIKTLVVIMIIIAENFNRNMAGLVGRMVIMGFME